MVLMSKQKAEELGVKPIAKIIGMGDAAQDPLWLQLHQAKPFQKPWTWRALSQRM